MIHLHKFNTVAVFEAWRVFEVENLKEGDPMPNPERYIAAVAHSCRCRAKRIDYFNALGKPCHRDELAIGVQADINNWLISGQVPKSLIYIGRRLM